MIRSRFNTYDNRNNISAIEKYDNNQGYCNFIKSRFFLESVATACSTLVEEMEEQALLGHLEKIDELTLSFYKTLEDIEKNFIPNLKKEL